jgi:hypothetical protein
MSTVQPRNAEDKSPLTMNPIGDNAGEYMRMERGRYDAWLYVVVAFLMQTALIGGAIGGLMGLVFTATSDGRTAMLGAGFLIGGVAAFFTFRDRWRCIEAFSSRWCSGVANLSLIYVPIVAFVYANSRAIAKLSGK